MQLNREDLIAGLRELITRANADGVTGYLL